MTGFISHSAIAVQKTNPDISVNILLLGKKSFSEEEHKEHKDKYSEAIKKLQNFYMRGGGHAGHAHSGGDGFSVQEVEIYFKSNIDPYWTGNFSVGVSQHGDHFDFALEEAYVESLFIPSLTFRAGQFFAFLGRHNNLHTHYYPFIDPPLINKTLFGHHGWAGAGASLAYLTPLPWYFEIMGQAFYTEDKPSGILFLKNLWDLNDKSTFELDLAYGAKVKTFKHLYNAAMVYKYQPLDSSKKHSVSWTTEFLQAVGDKNLKVNKGFNSYVQWQFLKQWWLQGRAEYLLGEKWKNIEEQKYSVLLAWTATEYSSIRLQYDVAKADHEAWEHAVSIQANMSLGAHPAHLY